MLHMLITMYVTHVNAPPHVNPHMLITMYITHVNYHVCIHTLIPHMLITVYITHVNYCVHYTR